MTGAGEKESDLFRFQQPEKMASSCLKDHLNISMQAGLFIRRDRESRTKMPGGGAVGMQ